LSAKEALVQPFGERKDLCSAPLPVTFSGVKAVHKVSPRARTLCRQPWEGRCIQYSMRMEVGHTADGKFENPRSQKKKNWRLCTVVPAFLMFILPKYEGVRTDAIRQCLCQVNISRKRADKRETSSAIGPARRVSDKCKQLSFFSNSSCWRPRTLTQPSIYMAARATGSIRLPIAASPAVVANFDDGHTSDAF
jgi:hypothetical protein